MWGRRDGGTALNAAHTHAYLALEFDPLRHEESKSFVYVCRLVRSRLFPSGCTYSLIDLIARVVLEKKLIDDLFGDRPPLHVGMELCKVGRSLSGIARFRADKSPKRTSTPPRL